MKELTELIYNIDENRKFMVVFLSRENGFVIDVPDFEEKEVPR